MSAALGYFSPVAEPNGVMEGRRKEIKEKGEGRKGEKKRRRETTNEGEEKGKEMEWGVEEENR